MANYVEVNFLWFDHCWRWIHALYLFYTAQITNCHFKYIGLFEFRVTSCLKLINQSLTTNQLTSRRNASSKILFKSFSDRLIRSRLLFSIRGFDVLTSYCYLASIIYIFLPVGHFFGYVEDVEPFFVFLFFLYSESSLSFEQLSASSVDNSKRVAPDQLTSAKMRETKRTTLS